MLAEEFLIGLPLSDVERGAACREMEAAWRRHRGRRRGFRMMDERDVTRGCVPLCSLLHQHRLASCVAANPSCAASLNPLAVESRPPCGPVSGIRPATSFSSASPPTPGDSEVAISHVLHPISHSFSIYIRARPEETETCWLTSALMHPT